MKTHLDILKKELDEKYNAYLEIQALYESAKKDDFLNSGSNIVNHSLKYKGRKNIVNPDVIKARRYAKINQSP